MSNATLSVRIDFKRLSQASNQHAHNTRKKSPAYADADRLSDNKTLHDSSIKLSHLAREIESVYKQSSNRKWRNDSAHFIDGIITFSRDAKIDNKSELDICAQNFISKMIEKNGLREDALVQLIRHEDESRSHFHFMLMNQKTDGRPARKFFDRSALKNLQGQAGEAFSSMGITRGISKAERLEKDPNANVIHKSVRQLHEDLPREIEAKQKIIEEIEAKIAKNENYLQKTNEKMKNENANISKLQKRAINYQNRIKNARSEQAKIIKEMSEITKFSNAKEEISGAAISVNIQTSKQIKREVETEILGFNKTLEIDDYQIKTQKMLLRNDALKLLKKRDLKISKLETFIKKILPVFDEKFLVKNNDFSFNPDFEIFGNILDFNNSLIFLNLKKETESQAFATLLARAIEKKWDKMIVDFKDFMSYKELKMICKNAIENDVDLIFSKNNEQQKVFEETKASVSVSAADVLRSKSSLEDFKAETQELRSNKNSSRRKFEM